MYVGIDRNGTHWIFPVQAKGGKDKHSIVQIEQDYQLCRAKFPDALYRGIAAQFVGVDLIALIAFGADEDGFPVIIAEKHYQLVAAGELTAAELNEYKAETLREPLD